MQVKLETAPRFGPYDVGETLFGWPIVATTPGSTQYILDVPDTELDVLDILQAHGDVIDWRRVHDDYAPLGWPVKGPGPLSVPGDTFPLVMADGCAERGRWGARPTRLGILDTGLDGEHIAFADKAVEGDLRDDHGHGTHCASTAASAWGIASDSAIYMLNVLPGGNGSEAGVANGFRQLADAGCDVISASLGGSPSSVIDAAVQYARSRGAIVVCAAGNGGDASPPGSPARAATVSVYAVDRANRPASFTDGKAWATTGSQGVDITAAARGTRTGAMTMSGTSMACPHVAGLLCLLRGAGLRPQECLDYLAQHRPTVPSGCAQGVLRLAADFGQGAPPPPEEGDVDTAAIIARALAIQMAVEQAQADRCAWGATKAQYQASMVQIMDIDIGPIKEMAREIEELAGKDSGGVQPPPPTEFDSFGGSYPGGHDPAFDLYPNGEYGPHLGHVFRCPVAGAVERYSFISPLRVNATQSWDIAVTHDMGDRAGGVTTSGEWSAAMLLTEDEREVIRTLGTRMHIAVFRPAQPLTLANGQPCRALWIGHVQPGFQTGARQAGDVLALCGESGIEFPNGSEAAHGHVCGSSDGSLSPNGNVDGAMVALVLGYRPRRTPVPGPQDYFSGAYFRGKHR